MLTDHPAIHWLETVPESGLRIGRSDEAVVVDWAGVGQLRAPLGGPEPTFHPAEGVDEVMLQHFRATEVLACTRYLRGEFSLHGSAVSWGGTAVALIGNSGAGKSTLAAALVERANAVFIADDIVPIDWRDSTPVAVPVEDHHWLTSESCRWLGARESAARKQAISPRARATAPGTLSFVAELVFDDGLSGPALDRLAGHASFLALSAAHQCYPVGGDAPVLDFEMRARLAAHVPVFQLRRPRRLEAIDAAAAMLASYASREHLR